MQIAFCPYRQVTDPKNNKSARKQTNIAISSDREFGENCLVIAIETQRWKATLTRVVTGITQMRI